VTDVRIREAAAGDAEAIGRIAIATGQDEEWAGSDPAYVRHLLAHGRLVVAEYRGAVTGFGATVRIGVGPAATTMLCDLFVDPRAHGLGLGQAMLAALWHDGTPRMTFSSLHAHALPLYARFGLDAWWPLLYLAGDVTALPAPAGWAVAAAAAGEVAGLERRWTGIDRTADHRAWAARPGGQPVLAERDGQPRARWPGRGRSTASFTWRCRRPAATPRPGTPCWPCWPAWTRPAAGPGPACPRPTRRSGRCSRRAGATTTWTCTWRPSLACSTRAGRSPPPAWPDRAAWSQPGVVRFTAPVATQIRNPAPLTRRFAWSSGGSPSCDVGGGRLIHGRDRVTGAAYARTAGGPTG
jgi:GNAT superfamily N-acetyltransferase